MNGERAGVLGLFTTATKDGVGEGKGTMPTTVFYSWQNDSPNCTNRNFIRHALEKAIENLATDATLDPAVRKDIGHGARQRHQGDSIPRDSTNEIGMGVIHRTFLSRSA